ncbi:MAG: hypothetical protein IJP69_01835 [Synergistaceae bacterium]|nr:hypothetical protein [Synergistaceae bacterium]MBR0252157.1 hypothetical protein [Synergistaceae bacterium]
MNFRFKIILCVVLCFLTCCSSEAFSEDSVLPTKGDIAVIVVGDEAHKSRVEANIINMLVNRGYRVVDEGKMKKIRASAARAQAARYALYGEFEKILKINASYSVAATIIANVIPEQAKENRLKLFTATASAAVLAVKSNGVKLGGKTSDSKQVGYTEAEAIRKAVDEAVKNGMLQLF